MGFINWRCLRCVIPLVLFIVISSSYFGQAMDLQSALDRASPGDTISVPAGIYGPVKIEHSVDLVAEPGAIIRTTGNEACIMVKADDVLVSGFIVRGGLYGIYLDGVEGCRISDNTVIYCKQPGIALIFSDNNTIEGNNASFNGIEGEGWYGIYLSNSNNNTIQKNVASNNGAYGIDLFPSCNDNVIADNIMEGNMYGLYMFTGCSGNVIAGNVMSNNRNSGLDMRFNCHDNNVLNNTMSQNAVSGISLLDSEENLISGNELFSNERFGLHLLGSGGRNLIISNRIDESRTGIFVESSGNILYGNRLRDNVIQAEDRGRNHWNATYPEGGNYWADYPGEDLMSGTLQDMPGSDGFGDAPYRISSESMDMYPIIGERFVPIQLIGSEINPNEATIGDEVEIRARFESIYGLSQVSVRVIEASGYVRMEPAGDIYKGRLATALFNPGTYRLVLTATDRRGYELEEAIGEVMLHSRPGRDFQAAIAEMSGR